MKSLFVIGGGGGDERAFQGSGAFMFVLVASRLFQTTTKVCFINSHKVSLLVVNLSSDLW